MASYFSLLAGHELAYNEVVRPTRRWAFSYYFLYRWLPRLHPQQAMLIHVLRQSTWQQGRPTGRCQLANATLCRLMGWAESSHKTLLTEIDRPYSAWFIERARTRKRHASEGHAVEGAPRYRVTMDDPLTPADQAALCLLLAQQKPESPYAAAEALSALSGLRSRELWAMLDAQPAKALPTTPATVAQVAARAWPHLADALVGSRPFVAAAEQLHLRLTGAGYAHMELDYLMRGWLPLLGVNQTWLVIALRARCFHDPATGETRDVVVLQRRELEAQLGLPERTFRRLLREDSSLPLFGISAADAPLDPAAPRSFPARGALAFHMAYPLLPVAPADQPRYEALLLGRVADALSPSGQPTRLDPASEPDSSGGVIRTWPANPAQSGQQTRLIEWQAASEPSSERPANPADGMAGGQPTQLDPASEPTIPSAFKSKKPQRPTISELPLPSGGGGEIDRLLAPYRIQGLARILANPELTPALVRGWILRGREEVREETMGGYLFRRLSSPEALRAEPLPMLYHLAGEIEPAESILFEQWWLTEVAMPPYTDAAQRDRYAAWLQLVKQERGDPDRPDYSPHARWRREMARGG